MALATRRGVTPDRASTLLFASLSPLPSVMGYTLHAGQALEEIPQRRGPLNLHGVKGRVARCAVQGRRAGKRGIQGDHDGRVP